MKKLSIITITYNAATVLERTLQSLYPIDNEQVEHWIIDGASTDSTVAIAQKYGVQHIISEPDAGLYDAMNKGLQKATAEYLWFLNAGDEVAEASTIQNLLVALETNADVYYSDTYMVNDAGSILGLRSAITPHQLHTNLSWQQFKYGMLVCHQSFIVKKSIAPAYILSHKYSADIDWEIKCLKAAKTVQLLPFVLSKYLVGGFSVKNLKASLWDRFIILKNHFGLLPTLFHHSLIVGRGLLFSIKKRGKYW